MPLRLVTTGRTCPTNVPLIAVEVLGEHGEPRGAQVDHQALGRHLPIRQGPKRHKLLHFFFPPLSGRCDSAEPAAVLLSFPVLPLFITRDAACPAFLPVCSFLAISCLHRLPDWSKDVTSWIGFGS